MASTFAEMEEYEASAGRSRGDGPSLVRATVDPHFERVSCLAMPRAFSPASLDVGLGATVDGETSL